MSEKAGVADSNKYYGLTAVFADVDDDGKADLLVANDSTPNYLYLNKGNGTFEDESYVSGFALNENGREVAGMGIAVGDYLNNGRIDLLITDFSDDSKVLYRNDGDANFTDVSYQRGIAEHSIPFLSWGDGFIDYDNDGWKDIFIANGHVFPRSTIDWGTTYAQRPLLFHNRDGKFELCAAVQGHRLGRGDSRRAARPSAICSTTAKSTLSSTLIDGPPCSSQCQCRPYHWVELKLTGGPKSPRDAVGAAVFLTANGMRKRADVLSSGSYISSNDKRAHFGLGTATDAGVAEIRWPSGRKETVPLPLSTVFIPSQKARVSLRPLCWKALRRALRHPAPARSSAETGRRAAHEADFHARTSESPTRRPVVACKCTHSD